MTKMECCRELSMLEYRMGLVDSMFAQGGFTLSWWVGMYGIIVTRFCAVAEAWAQLQLQGEGSDGTLA
jgi:hypothetical protein